MSKPKYDSSVARMAGNIAAGLVTLRQADISWSLDRKHIAEYAVALSRAIVAEVQRTEPAMAPVLCGNKIYFRDGSGDVCYCTQDIGHSGKCF